jgi:GAF domain-containing protein
LLSEDESELVFTTVSGAGADEVSGMRIGAFTGIAGWVVMSGQPIAVSDPQRDPRFARDVAETTGYVPSTILAVPVQTPHRLLGVVELLDRDERRADAERDMALLLRFADQAALAIAGERALHDLGRLLLTAASATVADRTLAEAIDRVASDVPTQQEGLADLAALNAELAALGEDERRLAVTIVRAMTAYARGRDRRRR